MKKIMIILLMSLLLPAVALAEVSINNAVNAYNGTTQFEIKDGTQVSVKIKLPRSVFSSVEIGFYNMNGHEFACQEGVKGIQAGTTTNLGTLSNETAGIWLRTTSPEGVVQSCRFVDWSNAVFNKKGSFFSLNYELEGSTLIFTFTPGTPNRHPHAGILLAAMLAGGACFCRSRKAKTQE